MSGRASTPPPALRLRGGASSQPAPGGGGAEGGSGRRIGTKRSPDQAEPSKVSGKKEKETHSDRYQALRLKRVRELALAYGAIGPRGEYLGFWSDPFCLRDFSREELARALPRLLFAVAFFAVGLYMNSVSQVWVQRNLEGYYERLCPGAGHGGDEKTLWDVTFKLLPRVESTKPADMFATSGPVLLAVRFLVVPGPLSLRWTILRRWLTVWGIIWMIRSLTIIVTPLPNPDSTCTPIISFPDNIFLEAFYIAVKKDMTCQDVLFSGHTVALTLSMMIVFKYSALAPWTSYGMSREWHSLKTIIGTLGRIYVLVGYYFIAGSRYHYTIDVVVGALVTLTAFNAYHDRIELTWLRKQYGGSGVLDHVLHWLEQDAKDINAMSLRTSGHSEDRWLDRQ